MKQKNKLQSKKILVTEVDEIPKEAIQMLEENGYNALNTIGNTDKKDIIGIFVRTYTKVTSAYLDQFPNIKFILRAGIGLENIDLEECKKRNIAVFNAPGSNANAVAEYLITVILISLRNLQKQIQQIQQGKWRDRNYIGEELQHKTIGLVGCGAIGKILAQKLQGFGVIIIGYDPYVKKEDLKLYDIEKREFDYVIKNADIITLQLPLNKETKNMFTINEFSKMKKTSTFINVSRGELVNEEDLITALKQHIISAAILDVFINEPNINKEILQIENLLATPHIGGFTKEADVRMGIGAVKNFLENAE